MTINNSSRKGYKGKYSEMVADVIDKLIGRENQNTEVLTVPFPHHSHIDLQR